MDAEYVWRKNIYEYTSQKKQCAFHQAWWWKQCYGDAALPMAQEPCLSSRNHEKKEDYIRILNENMKESEKLQFGHN